MMLQRKGKSCAGKQPTVTTATAAYTTIAINVANTTVSANIITTLDTLIH